MKGLAIYLALLMFSLGCNVVSEIGVRDSDGTFHSAYNINLDNQHLNISQDDVEGFAIRDSSNVWDIAKLTVFAPLMVLKLFAIIATSMWQAFYVVGLLTKFGVPGIMAWAIQAPIWYHYALTAFQIYTNRSLKAFE